MSLTIHTEIEVMIWIQHDAVTNPNTIDLQPRYLGFGYYIDRNDSNQFKFFNSNQADVDRFSSDLNGNRFFTAHIITFSNIPGPQKTWHFNCLTTAPVVSESISSLTSPLTDLSAITLNLADPDVRKFFDGSLTTESTQNGVVIYRRICNVRNHVWTGFVEGYQFGADRSTTLKCRPITKRFDQSALFGFNNKTGRWRDNDFNIPIIAARVVPWSVNTSSHSEVGAEPFTFLTSETDPTDDAYTNYRYEIDRIDPSLDLSTVFPADYSQSLFGSGAVYTDNPNLTKEENDRFKGLSRQSNENFREHLRHKNPDYVTFSEDELPPSAVSMTRFGQMSFERGIFFAPTNSTNAIENGRFYFDPSSENYQISPIPSGAVNSNFASACHLEKFFLGVDDFSITRSTGINNLNRPIQNKFAALLRITTRGSLSGTSTTVNRFSPTIRGFDKVTLFPSMELSDSYCNWTHVPAMIQGIPPSLIPGSSSSDTDNSYGSVGFPFPPDDYFIQPTLIYVRWNASTSKYEVESRGAHPLDSFYRWTLQTNKSSASESAYMRAVWYTPHALKLTYWGRGDAASTLADQWILPQFYMFTQWSTFLMLRGGAAGKRSHANEFRNFWIRGTANQGSDPYRYINPKASAGSGTWLSNGNIAVGAARCKDMYLTTPEFARHETIDGGLLGIFSHDRQPSKEYGGGARSNLRVMPAFPSSSIKAHQYPQIQVEPTRSRSGAYYVRATYDPLDEVGYWDSSIFTNPTAASAHEQGQYFKGRYQHDQSGTGQGVSPANFLTSICSSVGLRPNFDFSTFGLDNTPHPREMTNVNPMQLIADSGSSYRQLLDRFMAGIGKCIRFSPITNSMEIIDWTSASSSESREITATFDEDCMVFQGSDYLATSQSGSFIFENPDMLKGTNTLDDFGDDDFGLARYTTFNGTPFLQGKTTTIQTGTWWENPTEGMAFYDKLSDILQSRIDLLVFSVPNEILLGVGQLGTVSVGDWVRLRNESISPGGIADVFIISTNASEVETIFRAYKITGVGITDRADDTTSTPNVPLAPPEVPAGTNEQGDPIDSDGNIIPKDPLTTDDGTPPPSGVTRVTGTTITPPDEVFNPPPNRDDDNFNLPVFDNPTDDEDDGEPPPFEGPEPPVGTILSESDNPDAAPPGGYFCIFGMDTDDTNIYTLWVNNDKSEIRISSKVPEEDEEPEVIELAQPADVGDTTGIQGTANDSSLGEKDDISYAGKPDGLQFYNNKFYIGIGLRERADRFALAPFSGIKVYSRSGTFEKNIFPIIPAHEVRRKSLVDRPLDPTRDIELYHDLIAIGFLQWRIAPNVARVNAAMAKVNRKSWYPAGNTSEATNFFPSPQEDDVWADGGSSYDFPTSRATIFRQNTYINVHNWCIDNDTIYVLEYRGGHNAGRTVMRKGICQIYTHRLSDGSPIAAFASTSPNGTQVTYRSATWAGSDQYTILSRGGVPPIRHFQAVNDAFQAFDINKDKFVWFVGKGPGYYAGTTQSNFDNGFSIYEATISSSGLSNFRISLYSDWSAEATANGYGRRPQGKSSVIDQADSRRSVVRNAQTQFSNSQNRNYITGGFMEGQVPNCGVYVLSSVATTRGRGGVTKRSILNIPGARGMAASSGNLYIGLGQTVQVYGIDGVAKPASNFNLADDDVVSERRFGLSGSSFVVGNTIPQTKSIYNLSGTRSSRSTVKFLSSSTSNGEIVYMVYVPSSLDPPPIPEVISRDAIRVIFTTAGAALGGIAFGPFGTIIGGGAGFIGAELLNRIQTPSSNRVEYVPPQPVHFYAWQRGDRIVPINVRPEESTITSSTIIEESGGEVLLAINRGGTGTIAYYLIVNHSIAREYVHDPRSGVTFAPPQPAFAGNSIIDMATDDGKLYVLLAGGQVQSFDLDISAIKAKLTSKVDVFKSLRR